MEPHEEEGSTIDPSTLSLGDAVLVRSLGKKGELSALPDNRGRVTVSIGGFPVQVKLPDIDLVRGGGQSQKAKKKGKQPKKSKERRPTLAADDTNPATAFRGVDNTLDLRGQRVDEALFEVDRFLDVRSLSSDGWAFILHGHGTGQLRNAVRDHLSRSPYVAETTSGNRSQGGDGVTVVRLR
jgi:DNA mismatch repair protein MutS2